MRIKHDTHLHTEFSFDSNAPVSSQISRAIELGLCGICITDHVDHDYPCEKYPDLEQLSPMDLDDYKSEILHAADQYNDIEIYLGIECGMKTDKAVIEYNRLLCQDPDLDQVIGSIHLIDNNDPYYSQTWENKEPEWMIRRYFEITLDNIRLFSDFNTLGHMDYAVRYAPRDFIYKQENFFEITD